MPRTRDPDLRRRVLDTAGELFYAHGIQAIGMAQLVAAAGCGKSVLYREFPTKDDLVLAHLEEFAARRRADERGVRAEAGDDPVAVLLALTRRLADRVAQPDFRGCPFRNYLRELGRAEGRAGAYAGRWLASSRRDVRRLVVATGVAEADRVADQVWLVLDGLWASAPYRDRSRLGTAGLTLVTDLLTR